MIAVAVVVAALVPSLALLRLVSPTAPRALRLGAGIVFFNLFLLVPLHLSAASSLVAGVPFGPQTVLPFQLVVALPAVAYARKVAPWQAQWSRDPWRQELRELPQWIRAALVMVGLSYLVFAIDVLPFYPTGWDGLVYHLPLAQRWLQDGTAALPPSLAWPFSLPANAEMLMMLGLSTGVEQTATLYNVSAVLLIACAAYALARWLGAHRAAAVFATLLLLSMPIFEFQFFAAYVDTYAAGFVLFAGALFVYRDRTWSSAAAPRLTAILIGLCMAVAIGTKLTTLMYAAIMGLSMTIAVLHRQGARATGRFVVWVLAGLAVPLAFWVGRAWATTGNPLYPLEVSILGDVLFEGIPPETITPEDYDLNFVRSRAEWLIYPWTEWHESGYSFGTGQGFGAAFATFVPVALLYILLGGRAVGPRAKVLLGIVATSIVVWNFALQRVPRFAIPALALSCALAAPLIGDLAIRFRRALPALATLTLATTVASATIIPALRLARRLRADITSRAAYYGLPLLVDSLPRESTVLNVGPQQYNYGLAGRCLCNRVVIKWELPDTIITASSVRAVAPDFVVTHNDLDAEAEKLLKSIGFVRIHADRPSRPEGMALWGRGMIK